MANTITRRRNPFPGLRPFKEEEHHLFFGRERQVDAMIDGLRDNRFLAVVGTSGSGKSSLVNCGLLPALHGGLLATAGSNWKVAKFRPGNQPIRAMAMAMAKPGVLFEKFEHGRLSLSTVLETTLRMSKVGLVDCLSQARLAPQVNVLIVVDQFEELFRYQGVGGMQAGGQHTAEEAIAFVNLLLEASHTAMHPMYVVITMRSDFLGDCSQFAGLPETINAGQYLVPRMTRSERRSAIQGPVAVENASVSPVLLTRLVNDVGDNPDQLSILQHALHRTWASWEAEGGEGPLHLRHYQDIGTMAHALDQHAEQAYAELSSKRSRLVCEKMFKALTLKESAHRGVRRPTELGALCRVVDATLEEVSKVIEVFRHPSRSFLMPPVPEPFDDKTIIDISHESLMRIWDRLDAWAEEELVSARIYLRLAETARLYEKDKASLWRDPDLQLALDWRAENQPTPAWGDFYGGGYESAIRFLEESTIARDKEVQEKEEQRRREIEQARALAKANARIARRTMYGLIVMGILFVIAFGAYLQTQQAKQVAEDNELEAKAQRSLAQERQQAADESAREAEAQQLIAQQQQEAAERSAREAEVQEAIAQEERRSAQENALEAQQQREVAEYARMETEGIANDLEKAYTDLSASNNLVIQGREQTVGLALANRAVRLSERGELELGGLLAHQAFRFNERSRGEFANEVYDALRKSLNALDEGSIRLSGGPIVLSGHEDWVRSVAYQPGGSWVASTGNDGAIYLRDMAADLTTSQKLVDFGHIVRTLAFSPDGTMLAAGGDHGRILLWRDLNGMPERILDQGARVRTLSFSPDNRHLASGGDGNEILLHSLRNPDAPVALEVSASTIRALAFSRDGELLAAGGTDGEVMLWQNWTTSHQPDNVFSGHAGGVHAISFHPDQDVMATGGEDGLVRLWERGRLQSEFKGGDHGPVNTVAFSPDGKMLAAGSSDPNVRVWDLARPEVAPISLRDHSAWVFSIAFSSDSAHLASGSADGTVRIWTVRADSLAARLCEPLDGMSLTNDHWNRYVGEDIPYSSYETCNTVIP